MQNSLDEMYLIPTLLQEKGLSRCFLYCGSSMSPTFRPGQLLYVRPQAGDIVPGDVIVFDNLSANNRTVHRVISVSHKGLFTRGDNNRLSDNEPVLQEHLIGRVDVLDDQGHLKPVVGGKRGLWSVRIGWVARRIDGWLRFLFWKPYNTVRSSPLIRKFLYNWFSQYLKVVYFGAPDDPLIKTTYKGRTVARWWPETNKYDVVKPFDLVIPNPNEPK